VRTLLERSAERKAQAEDDRAQNGGHHEPLDAVRSLLRAATMLDHGA
jgi:hypothetical protein